MFLLFSVTTAIPRYDVFPFFDEIPKASVRVTVSGFTYYNAHVMADPTEGALVYLYSRLKTVPTEPRTVKLNCEFEVSTYRLPVQRIFLLQDVFVCTPISVPQKQLRHVNNVLSSTKYEVQPPFQFPISASLRSGRPSAREENCAPV